MLRFSAKSLLGSLQIKCLPLRYISASTPASVRYASLSAIHRGLRRSERIHFGPRRSGGGVRLEDIIGNSSYRQQQKLRKKLDRKALEAEEEDGTGRQTRRKRFLNPDSSFGKRSLVYQLKHGALKDAAASLHRREQFRSLASNDAEDRPPFRQPWREQPRNDRAWTGRPRHFQNWHDQDRNSRPWTGRPQHDQNWHDQNRNSRPWTGRPQHDQNWHDQNRNSRPQHDQNWHDQNRNSQPQHDQDWHDQNRNSQPWNDQDRHHEQREHGSSNLIHDIFNKPCARQTKRGVMPMTIPYTTAASQFLYGKSAVKAALEQGKRQLYNLYVYGGENRRHSRDNDILMDLARSRGVPVTIVPNDDQRLMDKMSMGRPHNGFILETSPLPQLPIKSLGQLEESPSRLGFHVKLDHQTAEQKSINGEDTFVRKARNANSKPLVLFLHEILDPGNLGAILRTASYMGIDAVAITIRGSTQITPVVLKSAVGAAEEVTIFTVNSPVEFLLESRAMGWKTYSAVAPPEKKLVKIHGDKFISTDDIEQTRPLDHHPCILVFGSEGSGLPRPIKVATEFELSVPKFVQDSSVDSLNVSVAAGLLCHSFVKQDAANSLVQEESATRPATEAVDSVSEPAVPSEKPSLSNSDDALF
ncbi:hypothetical protein E4U42_004895 [Claviceps africana]|uniref:rRNA methyltransferase 1, mitochondrial n=1 Tax=Claviceps africana TaxID=83212 RepID=A0A8K0J4G9_9HYPO|nr:hypothetical protein E4U42_004895 [Claviceps africana]